MSVKVVAAALAAALAGAMVMLVLRQLPDIQRYQRIRSM